MNRASPTIVTREQVERSCVPGKRFFGSGQLRWPGRLRPRHRFRGQRARHLGPAGSGLLIRQGNDPGQMDGLMVTQTEVAIMAFQAAKDCRGSALSSETA
jgi:hypothetical protein